MLKQNSRIHFAHLEDAGNINESILEGYRGLEERDFIRRSHSFGGRHENLYISATRIPGVEAVLGQAMTFAGALLKENRLRMGFWFNDMGPGDETSRHDHDEFDELLSAVYYVHVPENSGNLIIHDPHCTTEIKPKAGMFVFFSPNVMHSVSVNQSAQRRLSIAMNFGPE